MCRKSTAHLEGAIKAVNLLVQQKMLFKPKDEVALVLFGTKGIQKLKSFVSHTYSLDNKPYRFRNKQSLGR
jgi:hypothetical protein